MGSSTAIDQASLHFDEQSLLILNACIALVMFGIALNLRIADFKRLWQDPFSLLIGLFSQLVLLPLLTYFLVILLKPQVSIALGMFMLASCPGGNMSNFISSLSRANVALSISLTAITTSLAFIVTPLNFSLWTSLYPETAEALRTFNLSVVSVARTVFFLLVVPLAAGIGIGYRFPDIKQRIYGPIRWLSIAIFVGFILIACLGNADIFFRFFGMIMSLVVLHNGLAFFGGYGLCKLLRRPEADARAVAIETGIQNAALGLVLIFNFFDGLGGMAIITAWWGVWHLVAGLLLAAFWSRRKMSTI